MTKHTHAEPRAYALSDRLAIGSMILMAMLILLRMMSTHEPFPMWDSDPYLFGTPMTGIPAGYGILLNAVVMLLSLVILAVVRADGSRGEQWMRVLLGLGYAGLAVHLATDPQTLMDGSTLGAMIGGAVASAIFVKRYPEWIRVLVPVVLGSGVVLAVYGAHQVFIQHPRTVGMYELNRGSFLEARGWADGSFEAMTYERRLRQPEPTGWFGLSNVFASFMGAFGVAMVMVTLCSLKRAWWIASGLLGGFLLAILLISKSKGGIGATILGFGVLQYALVRHRGRASRIGTSTLGACVMVMLGVVGGAVVHQLSLLFRGQYMVGALRIYRDHPVFGVGPGRFQDAYMIRKPSTSPEDVTSAHNLAFDLLAQLGIGGVAWIGVLVVLIWSASLPKSEHDVHTRDMSRRITIRVITLMALFVGIVMIRVQSASLDLELMLILLSAVGFWIGIGVLLGVLGTVRTFRLAMLGGAVVLIIHGMLDLTPVMVVSGPMLGLCLGLGFGPSESGISKYAPPRKLNAPTLVAVLGLGVSGVLTMLGSLPVIQRDQALLRIAEPAAEASRIRMQAGSSDLDKRLVEDAMELIQSPIDPTRESVLRGMDQFEQWHRADSAQALIELSELHQDPQLTITALEQAMKAATALDQSGRAGSGPLWEWIGSTAEKLSDSGTSASELKWAGHAWIHIAQHRSQMPVESRRFKELAYQAWIKADTLAPHNPVHAIRLMELALELGNTKDARRWATLAIERSDRMKLDPLKQLSRSDLLRANELAKSE